MKEKLTLKQAQAKVSSLRKEINALTPKISMYADRCAKHMAELLKRGVSIDETELDENPYNLGRKYNLGTASKEFDILYKAIDAHRYMKENEDKLARAEKALCKYDEILSVMKDENDCVEKARNVVLSTLRDSFEGYKETYVQQAIAAHTRLFERAQENKPKLKAELESVSAELMDIPYSEHSRRRVLMQKREGIKSQLSHRVYIFNTLEEYLADIKKDIDAYWVSSLNRLADILYKKNAVSDLSATMRSCTSRGFSTIIREGSIREFDARMIWAAEDSVLVTPHFRYIVTERKL